MLWKNKSAAIQATYPRSILANYIMIEKLYLLLLFCASTTSFLPQHTTERSTSKAASRRTPAFAVPDSAGFTFDPFGGVSEPPVRSCEGAWSVT